MTTMDTAPSLTQFLTMRLAARAARKRTREEAIPRTWVETVVRLVWHLAGFTCLTIAGFSFNFISGMIAAGLSCFVMSTLTTVRKVSTETNISPRLR